MRSSINPIISILYLSFSVIMNERSGAARQTDHTLEKNSQFVEATRPTGISFGHRVAPTRATYYGGVGATQWVAFTIPALPRHNKGDQPNATRS